METCLQKAVDYIYIYRGAFGISLLCANIDLYGIQMCIFVYSLCCFFMDISSDFVDSDTYLGSIW